MKQSTLGVYIADPHFAHNTTAMRFDNFLEAISDKFLETLYHARDIGADHFVCLGDLFDKPEPLGIVRNRVISIINKGNDGQGWPFRIKLVLGNHDLPGHTRGTLEQTAVETLNRTETLDIIEEDEEFGIFAGHYRHDMEQAVFQSQMPIWAIHSYIVPDALQLGKHVLIDDFKTTPETRLVMSGHWHGGYSVYKRSDGVIFANPGSLGRVRISEDHTVKMAVVQRDGDLVRVDYVPLKTAKRPEMIFDMSLKKAKKGDVDAANFSAALETARVNVQMRSDSIDVVNKFASIDGTPKKVLDEAIRRIKDFRENDDDGN